MQKRKLAILDDYQKVALDSAEWSELQKLFDVSVFDYHLGDEAQVTETLSNFTVICCMRERTKFPESQLKSLPNLKLLVSSGAKNASIDSKVATEMGIVVCGTQSPGHAASELAWSLLSSLARNIHLENTNIRNADGAYWQTTIGSDLKGQTLGIVGLGRHGSNMARFAKAFGMNVMAWSQNLTEQTCETEAVAFVDKNTLFSEADFISVHLKMGKRNIGIIGHEEFSLMKPSSYIINTSRGPIIQEDALVKALEENKIAGAGLDVFDVEPLPRTHPLLKLENALLTSHVGFVTKQTYEVFYKQTVEAVLNWEKGNTIRQIN